MKKINKIEQIEQLLEEWGWKVWRDWEWDGNSICLYFDCATMWLWECEGEIEGDLEWANGEREKVEVKTLDDFIELIGYASQELR